MFLICGNLRFYYSQEGRHSYSSDPPHPRPSSSCIYRWVLVHIHSWCSSLVRKYIRFHINEQLSTYIVYTYLEYRDIFTSSTPDLLPVGVFAVCHQNDNRLTSRPCLTSQEIIGHLKTLPAVFETVRLKYFIISTWP